MSFFSDFYPIFSLLDDPFFTQSSYGADPYAVARSNNGQQQVGQRRRGGSGFPQLRTPRLQVHEEENRFVVDCELPGVRKENLEVNIGDGGRSLTIQGSTGASSESAKVNEVPSTPVNTAENVAGTSASAKETTEVAGQNPPQSTERWISRSSFSRTIWLPRPVDPAKVKAKLEHGILTLDIPKKEEQVAGRITVE